MTDPRLVPDLSGTPLWEIDHPYYCADSNFYVGGSPRPYPNGQPKPAFLTDDFVPWDHVEFESWADFGWKDSDLDMNLLFRWDWKVPDPEDYDEEALPPESLYLYWMLQRKGRFMVVSFPVQREDEPEIRAWLETRWEHMRKLWEPFSAAPDESLHRTEPDAH